MLSRFCPESARRVGSEIGASSLSRWKLMGPFCVTTIYLYFMFYVPFSERAIERSSDRGSDRVIERASERSSERSSDRASERASERARDVFLNISRNTLYTSIYFHIPSYTFLCLKYCPYTFIYLHIPSYLKISNIGKMKPDIRHKHDQNSIPRASPTARIWHAPSYHIPRGFAMPKVDSF